MTNQIHGLGYFVFLKEDAIETKYKICSESAERKYKVSGDSFHVEYNELSGFYTD